MANCKLCDFPLTKGNIRVIRPRGKKRPYRIHRRCPEVVHLTHRTSERLQVQHVKDMSERDFGTAGNVVQRPQVSTGDPLVVEGVLEYSEPPKYRYFVTRATAEKLQRAIKGGQVGITVEVMPVPEYQVEANPEALADYVEISFNHYAADH